MEREALNRRLFGMFMSELDEHRRSLDRDLIALESGLGGAARKELLESLFRSAHSLKGAARSIQIGSIERICHRLEQRFQELRGNEAVPPRELMQLLFAEVDALGAEEGRLSAGSAAQLTPPPPDNQQAPSRPPPAREPQRAGDKALRVSTEKIDGLLSQSGELGGVTNTLEARCADFEHLRDLLTPLRQALGANHGALNALNKALEHAESDLRREVAAVARASERLDDQAQRLRMVPFLEACEGLERALRDLSHALDRPVELAIQNGQVEIDRAVAQRLRDPLLHLLRNAVTHGIEGAAERDRLGKPATARIEICAELRGKTVEIKIQDDGRGFDLQRVRGRARGLGLDPDVPEAELLRYAFFPGFSTASGVTEIAGRGVGLDAVKRGVEAMHGSVDIRSTPGEGACFALRLPLTLSKLRCLLVSSAGSAYAIPASHVVRVCRFSPDQVLSAEGRELLKTPEGLVPLASLSVLLGLKSAQHSAGQLRCAVVLRGEERMVALLVEELGAEREITARALPARLAGARLVTSAALLEQARLALVLNPQDLCRRALASPLPRAALLEAVNKARPRVLVAEDSPTTRAVLKSVLEEAHYEVTTAQDGEEALAMLERGPYDIVVSDVQMPHCDGFSLTESLRQHQRLGRIPVILMTSLESEADRLRGMRAGASAYLTKSAFDHRTLLETMATLL
jgi:two-component system chemotaxis sensor kinase CheA